MTDVNTKILNALLRQQHFVRAFENHILKHEILPILYKTKKDMLRKFKVYGNRIGRKNLSHLTKLEKLRQVVIDNRQTIANNRSTLETRWNGFYDLYRGLRSKGTYRGRADLDWASAFVIIETLVPRIHNILFPRGRWFDIIGVEETDDKQASILAAYLKQLFERDIKFRLKMIPALRSCAIFGTLIGKTPFRSESKEVPSK